MTTSLPREVEVNMGPAPVGFHVPLRPVHDNVEDERLLRKQELAVAFRVFGKLNFSEGVAGHISVRDPGIENAFWVNPWGTSFNLMKVSDLILVDHDGNLLQGNWPINKAAFSIHSMVHAARPDAVAAAHAHSLHGRTYGSLNRPLDPITQDAAVFFEDHALYSDYGGVATELDEAKDIATTLGDNKALIMANHGLLTVGRTVPEAAWWFILLDRSCHSALMALAAGTPRNIEPDTARAVREQTGGPIAGWFQFQPMWDEIIAADPGVFD